MSPTITHRTLRRTFREGACPILEVTCSYPCLGVESALGEAVQGPEEGKSLLPEVARFNEAYGRMAEDFLRWAGGEPLETAQCAFWAAGPSAVHSFDRRTVACDMAASLSEKMGELWVTRCLRTGSRRGGAVERERIETDVWRWPELTLRVLRKKQVFRP